LNVLSGNESGIEWTGVIEREWEGLRREDERGGEKSMYDVTW
jgi:hypothetical protein